MHANTAKSATPRRVSEKNRSSSPTPFLTHFSTVAETFWLHAAQGFKCRYINFRAYLLSHNDHTINQISETFAVRRDTVSRWIDAWETDGLEGFTDKDRAGRPTIYDEQDRERLKTLVLEAPHQIKAVQARLQQETGKSSCTTTIKRALKKLGYSFKRARLCAGVSQSPRQADLPHNH